MTREDRIKLIFHNSTLTQVDFANKIGVSQQMISEVFKGKKKAGDKIIMGIIDNFSDINPLWLLKEEGNMLKSESELTYQPEGKLIEDKEYQNKEVYVIPIKGRGGLNNSFFADELMDELEKENMQVKKASKHSKYFKIEVEGISMDDGSKKSLAEGDWVYCRSIPKLYWKSKLHAHKWDMFCFFHNERGIIFKKIKDHNVEIGELLLESIHPDKIQFPDFTIKLSECTYVCNIIKVLTNF